MSKPGRAGTARKGLVVSVAKNFTWELALTSEDAEMAVDLQELWAQNTEHFQLGDSSEDRNCCARVGS